MRKNLLLLVPLLLVTFVVGACTTNGETVTVTVTEAPEPPPDVIDDIPDDFSAEGYLASVCASCHGAGLGGDVGPTLLGLGDRMTAQEAAEIIAEGKHGTSMPTWDGLLTPEQIDLIADELC